MCRTYLIVGQHIAIWKPDYEMHYLNIGSSNGLLPSWCQTITWSNTDVLPIGPLKTLKKLTIQGIALNIVDFAKEVM